MTATVWTIGHSNRSFADFLALLHAHEIELVADVRRFPRSRRHPHFSKEALERALSTNGIAYVHLEALGGHREPRPDSPHTALPAAFRGYADHMETPEFSRALERLIELARERRTAAMCAEAKVEDCHRNLLADRLVARGERVLHAIDSGSPKEHTLHPAARRYGDHIVYDSGVRQTDLGDWGSSRQG